MQTPFLRLKPFFIDNTASPYNYIRNLVCEKTPYLEKFIKKEPFPPFEVEIQMSSFCNLRCRWCVGHETQTGHHERMLPDKLHRKYEGPDYRRVYAIEKVVEDIKNMRTGNLGVELVKFSGFIGEPLMHKRALLQSIDNLNSEGMRIGLFTNGVFMDNETWPILSGIYYVNVSLDAGPCTYCILKEPGTKSVPSETFGKVIENIRGLSNERKARKKNLNITVSYVIVPENLHEICLAANMVKEAGADGIRFKCDIAGGIGFSMNDRYLDEMRLQLDKTMLNADNEFKVSIIHKENDILKQSFRNWNCKLGCLYHRFVGTVGSDGGLYLCDHNTMPGARSFGNLVAEKFSSVWEGEKDSCCVSDLCRSSVCPPFANAVNPFLQEIEACRNQFGPDAVIDAIQMLKKNTMDT